MNLKQVLTDISLKWGYRLQETSADQFTMEVSLVRNKVDTRYMIVIVQSEIREDKPARIYIQGYCGIVSDKIPLNEVLKTAIGYNYCTPALLDTKDKNGYPVTELIIQACPQEEYTPAELLDSIIFEVADKADYLVMKYFEGSSSRLN